MSYIKEYFHGALDFSGEEHGDMYRKYCLIHAVGLFILGIALPVVTSIIRFIIPFDFFDTILGMAIFAVSFIWVEPIAAATVRRTWTLGKSKIWVFIVLLPGGSLLAWLLLGNDKEN